MYNQEWVTYLKVLRGTFVKKAKGKGRGHWGHKGRKGKRGGSLPSKGVAVFSPGDTKFIKSRRKLVKEWGELYGEGEGPFWKADGEDAEYFTLRDNRGKLIGGGTLFHYPSEVLIMAIVSKEKGGGTRMVEDIIDKHYAYRRRSVISAPVKASEGFWRKVGFIPKKGKGEKDWVYAPPR